MTDTSMVRHDWKPFDEKRLTEYTINLADYIRREARMTGTDPLDLALDEIHDIIHRQLLLRDARSIVAFCDTTGGAAYLDNNKEPPTSWDAKAYCRRLAEAELLHRVIHWIGR